MLNIVNKPSKNFSSRGPWAPNIIVNHITGGSRDSSMINEFQNNNRASSTFGVGIDGTVYQFVDIRKAAWGNGTSPSKYYMKDGVRALSQVWNGFSLLADVRNRKVNTNIFTISIEHVNAGGGILTPAQLKATIDLHKYIRAEVKRIYGINIPIDRQHITGHCFISPKTKPSCPGAQFPYDAIISGLLGTVDVRSDTTCDMVMTHGATYTFKLTSVVPPDVTIGTGKVLIHRLGKHVGDNYFYQIQAIGKSGDCAGVFVNGRKIFAVCIK